MKDLVYSRSSQVAPDKEESGTEKKTKLSTVNIISMATGAVAAFSVLDKTDLKRITQSVVEIVKVPWVAAGIIAAYVLMGVSSDAHLE